MQRVIRRVTYFLVAGALSLTTACGVALTIGGGIGLSTLKSDDARYPSNTPPAASVTDPTGTINDIISIEFRLTDPESDLANILVEYSNGGSPYVKATRAFAEGSEGTTNLKASPSGEAHTFLWNSSQDLGLTQNFTNITVRVTPSGTNSGATGVAVTTQGFDVLNRYITTMAQRPVSPGVYPFGMDLERDSAGNVVGVVLADTLGNRVIEVANDASETTTVLAGTGEAGYAGDGVLAKTALLNAPNSVVALPGSPSASGAPGDLLVSDSNNGLVRKIERTSGFITAEAGGGFDPGEGDPFTPGVLATNADLDPSDVAVDGDGALFILESTRARVVNRQGTVPFLFPRGFALTNGGEFLTDPMSVAAGRVYSVLSNNPDSGGTAAAGVDRPALTFPTLDEAAAIVYFGDAASPQRGFYVLELGPRQGAQSTFGNDGAANPYPRIVVVNQHTADLTLESSLRVTPPPASTLLPIPTGIAAVVADSGPTTTTRLPDMSQLADMTLWAGRHDVVLFSTGRDSQVWCMNLSGTSQTVLGTSVASREVKPVAGKAFEPGMSGDGGLPLEAKFAGPLSLTSDALGNVFLGEANNRVRVLTDGASAYSFGSQTFPAGASTVGSVPVLVKGHDAALVTPLGLVAGVGSDVYLTDLELGDLRSNRVLRVRGSDAGLEALLGNGVFGDSGDGGPATSARIGIALRPALDPTGTLLCVADVEHHRVRAVNISASPQTLFGVTIQPGEVETVVGTGSPSPDPMTVGDGAAATAATLKKPTTLLFDSRGLLWIGDEGNFRVRVANPKATSVTVAGVTIAAGTIQTVVGTGVAPSAPNADGDGGAANLATVESGAPVLQDGELIYLLDGQLTSEAPRVRAVNTGAASVTVAGVALGPGEINTVVGADSKRLADDSNLGDGGAATSATFRSLGGIDMFPGGLLLIPDPSDHRIRVVNTSAADQSLGGSTVAAGTIQTLLGIGVPDFAGDKIKLAHGFFGRSGGGPPINEPTAVVALSGGRVLFTETGNAALRLINMNLAGQVRWGLISAGPGESVILAGSRSGKARVVAPYDLKLDAANRVFFSDDGFFGAEPAIKQIDPQTRIVTVVAGAERETRRDSSGNAIVADLGDGGKAHLATFQAPRGLYLDGEGSIYIADSGNQRIRFVNRATGARQPIQGVGGVTVQSGQIDTIVDGSGSIAPNDGQDVVGGDLEMEYPTSIGVAGASLWITDSGTGELIRINTGSGKIEGVIAAQSNLPISPPSASIRTAFVPDSTSAAAVLLDGVGGQFIADGVIPGDVVIITGSTGSLEIDGSGVSPTPADPEFVIVSAKPTAEGVVAIQQTLGMLGGSGNITYAIIRALSVAQASVPVDGTNAYVAFTNFFGGGTYIYRVTYDTLSSSFAFTRVAGMGTPEWNGDHLTALDMQLSVIGGMAFDGSVLFVSDVDNSRVVAINTDTSNSVTIAGLTIAAGEARTIAGGGSGQSGFNGDAVPPNIALLNQPTGVAATSSSVFLVDLGNARIRRFQR